MFLRALSFVLALAVPAAAQSPLDQPFDASVLTYEEKRVVQAALAVQGDYVGLLDGDWGRGSQSALERFTTRALGRTGPTFGDLAPLVRAFGAEWQSGGWQTMYFDTTNTSFVFPHAILAAQGEEMTFVAPDQSMGLVITFDAPDAALGQHRYVLEQAAPGTEPYSTATDTRVISAATDVQGTNLYLRSDVIEGGYVSLFLLSTQAQQGRAALIAASMQRGRAPDLAVPPGGVLEAILAAVEGGGPSTPAPQPGAGGRQLPKL